MKVSTMRRVDAWLGIPGCALSTLWRKVADPFRRRPSGPVRRILFVKLAEQGSTVLAYAALRRAVDRVGAENVFFLAFRQNREILDAMRVIPPENVVDIRTGSILRTLLSTLAAVRRLRRLRVDAAIDLEFFARSTAIVTWLSGAPRRVGLHAFTGDGPWRGDLMTHRLAYNPHVHTSQVFRLQVDALDLPPERFPTTDLVPTPLADLPRGCFVPDSDEISNVEAILCEVTGRSAVPRLVLLNANCSDLLPLRRWSEASYKELTRHILAENPDVFVAFTGAPAEAEPVDLLVRSIGDPRCVSLAGRTTLRQLLVVYHLAELLVTNDSGPAHFASLTQIDLVTLFGPETPKLFGVLSPRSHVHWAETACSPCVNAYNNRVSACVDNVCMQRIRVEDVLGTVREVLASRARDEHRVASAPTPEPLWVPPQRTAGERRDAGRRRIE